jgi:hypothetical protein
LCPGCNKKAQKLKIILDSGIPGHYNKNVPPKKAGSRKKAAAGAGAPAPNLENFIV